MSILRNLGHDLATRGWKSTTRRVVGKVGRLVYSTETLCLLLKRIGPIEADLAAAGRRAVLLDFDELVRREVENAIRLPKVIMRRYRRGDKCWGVLSEGALVHIAWEAPRMLPIDRECVIPLPGDTTGIFDMYTYPEHRGVGHQSFMLRAICMSAYERGFRHAVATVHPGNVPSLRAFRGAGFSDVGEVRYRLLFGVRSADLRSPQPFGGAV